MNAEKFDLSDPEAVSFCPECGFAYRGGVAACSDCQASLISRAEAERELARLHEDAKGRGYSERLTVATDEVEEGLIRARLDQAEIAYFLHRFPQTWGRFLGLDGEVQIFVDKKDLARARQVLGLGGTSIEDEPTDRIL